MSAPALQALAEFAAGICIDRNDVRLRERLWTTVADWASALLAGTGHPLIGPYRRALLQAEESGPASVVAAPGRYPVAAAAGANAAIGHFWEVDDTHRSSSSHPGSTVFPAVLALAEARGLDAATVAAAVVAGFEVVLRVGSHLGGAHYRHCHTTATAGSLGAAAAVARGLGLDAERTLWALGHAGTQAAGLWAFLDEGASDAKGFHAATAVRNGLAAAFLAEAGIPGATRILEAPRGMRAAWHLTDCDPAWLLPGAEPMIHSVTVKGWPVCGQIHSALDCAVELAALHPELARSAAPVTVDLPASAIAIAGLEAPQRLAEAKFSTSFCIAAALCGKPPSFTGLDEGLLADREVRARAAQVALREDPAFRARVPLERPARVTLHGRAGDVSEERSFRRGDPEAPWTRESMIGRTEEVLALTPLATDKDRLLDWCDGFAEGRRDWRPDALFGCIEPLRDKAGAMAQRRAS